MTVNSPQVGFTLTGINPGQAQTIIGRDNTLQWEAVGYGPQGRPDYVENVKFNITLISGTNGAPDGSSVGANPTKVATISFAAGDIEGILINASTLTYPVNLTLTEIIVCNNGASGRMMVLGSQVYN